MSIMFPIYFISMALSAGLSVLPGYQILELSDLDCDYIKPQACCATMNRHVVPELLLVGIIVFVNLVTMNWIPVATTLPLLSWLIYTYRTTPRGYVNLFDPASIREEKVLNKHVRHCLFKSPWKTFVSWCNLVLDEMCVSEKADQCKGNFLYRNYADF